jgi:hypothetical protein
VQTEETAVAKQQLDKQFPRQRTRDATMKELLEAVFSMRSVPRTVLVEYLSDRGGGYIRRAGAHQFVRGGDEKEVSNLGQYNMVTSPTGLGPENDCAGEGWKHL